MKVELNNTYRQENHKFKIGDKVIYTNSNGVCWGERTIIGLDERTGEPTYYIDPTDTPWFSVREDTLKLK
jgi:hypothetical protein